MGASLENLKLNLISYVATPLAKAWFSTVRVEILNPGNFQRILSRKERFVFATWHRGAIFFLYHLGYIHAMVMFSQSRDGEYITRFAERTGTIPARGSSSRGGGEAFRKMVRHLRNDGLYCSTVLDGPRGPAFRSKPGMVLLAQLTGVPVMPILWSSPNPITFKKTWDGTMLPRPFGKAFVLYEDPIFVPRGGPEVLETYNGILERKLNEMKDRLDRMCGYESPI